MKWSEQAWQTVTPIYQSILQLEFIKKLMDGSLEVDAFRYYIQQDAIYLHSFNKALSGLASKLNDFSHSSTFLSFASSAIDVERNLHSSFFESMGKDNTLKASPTCLLYSSYLLRQLHCSSIEEAIASVLPCFLIYKKVGDFILEHQTKSNNIYQDWINTYAGEGYEVAVTKAIAICDDIADKTTESRRKEMLEAYVLCSKMEWMFWDSAYKKEQWPV